MTGLELLRMLIREQLDIRDPMHNVREIVKQLILLDDHLCCPEKRCMDCIKKHLLAAEALADEAISLSACRSCSHVPIAVLPDLIRRVYDGVVHERGYDFECASSDVRSLRKMLQRFV